MKILVLNWQDWTHPRAGGAEFHLREVFTRIVEREGHRVDLLCVAYPGAASDERLDGINILRRGSRYETFNYVVPRVYRRALRHNRYDLVVDDINKVPFYAPLFVRRPIVAIVHHLFGRTLFKETNPVFASYVWTGERAISRVYDSTPLIAVSPSTQEELVDRGLDADHISMIPNGVSDEAFASAPEAAKAVDPLFAYVGRLKRYKAIELIIEAFSLIVPEYPHARLVIAGDGDHRSALERRVAAGGIRNRVEFVGWLDERAKWDLLRSAWALCYASPKEGWGISSLEAQAVGTIAIVSDTPGLRDTVIDGETGWLVEHGSTIGLADRMRWAIEQPASRKKMEHKAVRRGREFAWDPLVDQALEVFERVAEQR